MNTIHTAQAEVAIAQNDLHNGLFVLELEERLEMATLVAAAALSQRCDVESTPETV